MGEERLWDIAVERAALLGAGGRRRPDAFAPGASGFAAGPLREASLDDDEASCPLCGVVGRLQIGSRNEAEVFPGVFLEPLGQVPRFGSRRALDVFALYAIRRTMCEENVGAVSGAERGRRGWGDRTTWWLL